MTDHPDPGSGGLVPDDEHDEPDPYDDLDDDLDDDFDDASGGRGRLIAIVLGVVVLLGSAIAAGVAFTSFGADERSAVEGPEGTRTFEGLPRELPETLLPEGATDIEGSTVRAGDSWSAAATFEVRGDHDALARAADNPLRDEGFALRQRAYDDTTMQVIYDHEDGSVLTITYRRTDEGDLVRVAAALIGP